MFICLRSLPSLVFVCGGLAIFWALNLVRYSVKILQNMIYNRTQQSTPPPPPQIHTVCIHFTLTQGRGEIWTKEKVRGATVHKAGSKIPDVGCANFYYSLLNANPVMFWASPLLADQWLAELISGTPTSGKYKHKWQYLQSIYRSIFSMTTFCFYVYTVISPWSWHMRINR